MIRLNKFFKLAVKFMLLLLVIATLASIMSNLEDINSKIRKKFKRNMLSTSRELHSDSHEWTQLKHHYRIMSITSNQLNYLKPYCNQIPDNVRGNVPVIKPASDFSIESNESIIMSANYAQLHGKWQPVDCKARHRVAIIIPYKDRLNNLKYFLNHMHPFLQKQELEYQIFVVEQSNDQLFNKGILMNAGFLEIMSLSGKKQELDAIDFSNTELYPFDCVIFHDVDLLPQDDRIMYSCPSNRPRHLSVAIDKYKYRMAYFKLIGGVLNFKLKQFVKVNGYSNEYWGWGAEDDDMEARLNRERIGFERPHIKIARYTMIKHKARFKNPQRRNLLKQAKKRYQIDGLNNVEYVLVNSVNYKYYTHMFVDVGDPPSYILKLLNKNDSNITIMPEGILNTKNLTN